MTIEWVRLKCHLFPRNLTTTAGLLMMLLSTDVKHLLVKVAN